MTIYNVVKIDVSGSTIVSSVIGYVNSDEDKNTFEGIHGTPLTDWAKDNPGNPLVEYFDIHESCYLIDTVSQLKDGLSLITNLENPES